MSGAPMREPTPDEKAGIEWWNSLHPSVRFSWLLDVSPIPWECWQQWKRMMRNKAELERVSAELWTMLERIEGPR